MTDKGARKGGDFKTNKSAGKAGQEQKLAPKKLVGLTFYIMLMIAIIKDVLDALANLTLILSLLSIVFSFLAVLIFGVYYYINKVKPTTRKVVTWAVAILLDSIPFISFLPLFAIGFILTRIFENSKLARTVVSKVPSAPGYKK